MTSDVLPATAQNQDVLPPLPSPTTMSDSRAPIEKACELLTAFGADGDRVFGVSELARRAGLAKTTAYRQLERLQRANMVERIGHGYRVGQGLRALANAVSDGLNSQLSDALLPYMVELFEVTRHTVQLSVLCGTDTVVIGKISGHRTVATPTRLGSRLPAHCTAGGKMLLAHHDNESAALLAGPLQRVTSRTVASSAQLLAEFDSIRRTGLAVDDGGAALGVACVASAVLSPRGVPIAAMSVCAPAGAKILAMSEPLGRISRAASRHMLRSPIRLR